MRHLSPLIALALLAPAAGAQQRSQSGPIIHSTGAVYAVPSPDFETARDQEYKVAFEIGSASPSPDRLNVSLNTVARYLNMHAQAGVPADQVHAAVVVHGTAGWEMLDDDAYRERHGVENPNSELIRELVASGAQVILCGQTAAGRGIPTDRLADGVQLSLSAMTAFLVLQEEGYRVNPW